MLLRGLVTYSIEFITEFPDQKQGYFHIDTEDKAGIRNVVGSFDQSYIWVDNVAPELTSVVVGEDGRSLKLSFTEELDTIPNISDYQLSVTDPVGVNPVNTVNLTNANISTNDQGKSDVIVSLALPIFQGDQVVLQFVSKILLTIKIWSKAIFDPAGSPAIINEFTVIRSDGTVIDGFIKGAEVFHDRDMDGVKDENEALVATGDDGTFQALNGDVDKPSVSIGGIDISTGLPLDPRLEKFCSCYFIFYLMQR